MTSCPNLPFWAVIVIYNALTYQKKFVIYNALAFYYHSSTMPFSIFILFTTIVKFCPDKIDFDIVGIPQDDDQANCKILLTTQYLGSV